MTRLQLLLALTVAACYQPAGTTSCALTCDPANSSSDCPGDFLCNTAGRCSTGGIACLPDSGVETDGMVTDATPPVDDPPGQFCIGTSPIRPCFASEPTDSITLTTGFNTDTGSCPFPMDLDGRPVCVLAGRNITFTTGITGNFTGARPLVVVGVFSITVALNTTLDLSSSSLILPRAGAGSQPEECQHSGPGGNNQDGAGGGAFASKGGDGGTGTGGTQGGVSTNALAIKLHGGCEGAPNQDNQVGGPGGGAVYLISNAAIINGKIRATGGGGTGGADGKGGAGGGTGGYIGIDAATVSIGTSGLLVATGGGGGGGGCMGMSGLDGLDADTGSNIQAGGGAGADTNPNGNGGHGSNALNAPGQDGFPGAGMGCGGGGGGGGPGTIQFFRGKTCLANKCFPSAVTNP